MQEVNDYEAKNIAVRNVVEQAISALEALGMPYDGALRLLASQAIIRMDDISETMQMLRYVQDGMPTC
jgi:hypothetical protein